MLEQAGTMVRQRRLAQVAWERIERPEWRAATEVRSVERGVVVVAVRGVACCGELRSEAQRLGRELSGLMPAVRAVRFVLVADGLVAGHEERLSGSAGWA
jgi:hypothetical protein